MTPERADCGLPPSIRACCQEALWSGHQPLFPVCANCHSATGSPKRGSAPVPEAPDSAETKKSAPRAPNGQLAAANEQLEDVDGFIKEHSKSPNLLDYIDRTTALRAAIKAGDPDEIERKMTELSASLSHDKDYQQHLAEQAEAQKKRDAQYLSDAIRRGEQERDFILDYIGKNPSADVVPAFAALVKQLNPALQQADLNQLQPLVDKVDLAIREANLEDEFIAAQKKAANSSDEKAETTPNTQTEKAEPTVKLPVTDKNRFLVEGDLGDVEILYNASSERASRRPKSARRFRLRSKSGEHVSVRTKPR